MYFENFCINDSNTTDKLLTSRIPKFKATKELLEECKDPIYENHIKGIISNSFNNKNNSIELGYCLTLIQLVNNDELDAQYITGKKERKNKAKGDKKLYGDICEKQNICEKKFFYACNDEKRMLDIVKNGFECIEAPRGENHLGDSSQGIHFCKCMDLMLKYEYSKKNRSQTFYCIIADVFYDASKMKYNSVSQIDNKNNGAETGFEGYFPKMTDRPDQEKLILEKFRENSVFFYELDSLTGYYLSKPSNMRPFAVLKYILKNPYVINRNIFSSRPQKKMEFNQKKTLNQNRYFNCNTNLNELESNQPIKVENFNKNVKFVQSDFIPLKGVTPKQPVVKPMPQLRPQSPRRPQLSQYELFVEQKKREQLQELEFEKQQNERVKNGLPKFESDATRLVPDFRSQSPPPDYVAKKESIYSDDDETDDELELLEEYFLEYKDRFESNDEKMPKWRIMYELTGKFEHVFRASQHMSCKLKNIDNMKLKFTDTQQTTINVKEPTNNFILKYEEKKVKSKFVTSRVCEHKVKYFRRDSDDSNDRIVKISTGKNSYVTVDFSVVPVCVENEIKTEIKEEETKKKTTT